MDLLRIVPKQAYPDIIIWIERIVFLTTIYQEVSEPESLRRFHCPLYMRIRLGRFHGNNQSRCALTSLATYISRVNTLLSLPDPTFHDPTFQREFDDSKPNPLEIAINL